MDHPKLLTDTQVAQILNCPLSQLPQRQQQGQIEAVQLRDRRLYRLVKPQPECPDNPAASTPPPTSQKETDPGHHPVNTDNLIKPYEDRGKIIQLLEKNHSLHLKKLFARIKRLRQHRLALVISLEILCGIGIIPATLAHDKLDETRTESAEMVLMAQHHEKQYVLIQQDQKNMKQQAQKRANRFKESQLEQARLETKLEIQQVKITEARKMITRLLETVELSGEKMAKDSPNR